MTPDEVARAYGAAAETARRARSTWETTTDLPDKDAAGVVMRQATALERSLESWIAKRALRAALAHGAHVGGGSDGR